ncbi:MAG: aminotransferase class V-fold PLP-dependent enzyme [Oscillospiraceae bacterium]
MIYLDSAATTLQKPPAVAKAMAQAVSTLASPGRGGHRAAMRAAEKAYDCRRLAAELLRVAQPERVIFTTSATHGLNIAIRSLVKPGSTALISGFEHNAVTRTLASIPNVTIKTAESGLFAPEEFLRRFEELLTPEVETVISTHVSNVFGYILPIESMAKLCADRRVPLIVDASQSAGCLPIDGDGWGASFVAMPGHKGLYGPQGTGLLLCGGSVKPTPILTGGTGSASREQQVPEFLPDRLEAGTHNMPGIAGLYEGLRFLRQIGSGEILRREQELVSLMAQGLAQIKGVEPFCDGSRQGQTGVVSFRIAGQDCEAVGADLDRAGIAVRAGLHCAPFAHRTAGTLETGTVRASVSGFNTRGEIAAFLRAVRQIAAKH